jgi:hypothetical protein
MHRCCDCEQSCKTRGNGFGYYKNGLHQLLLLIFKFCIFGILETHTQFTSEVFRSCVNCIVFSFRMRLFNLVLVAALSATASAWLTAPKGTAANPIRITCVGDSITAGTCSNKTHGYPAVLQQLLGSGYSVSNYGNSGCVYCRYTLCCWYTGTNWHISFPIAVKPC